MELIDRYVFAVTERLPEDTREDVAKELRANIEDMLPDNPAESDVRAVLEKLGNPAVLSNEYRQVKRYLVGPALYDSYISVLKLVIGIAVVVFVFLALLGSFSKPITGAELFKITPEFFADILASAAEGAVQAFLWVTVVFAVLERSGVSGDLIRTNGGIILFGRQKWSVDDLQPVPVSVKSKISRGETIVGIVFTVLFTAFFIYQPHLIGLYTKDASGAILTTPFFQAGQLQAYIPAIVLLALFQLGMSAYKFITMRWTLPLAVANIASNLAVSILICIMFTDSLLVNPGFVSGLANLMKISVSRMEALMHNFFLAFAVIFIIICTLDSINGFVKCRKKR